MLISNIVLILHTINFLIGAMDVCLNRADLLKILDSVSGGSSIGFVPTMGALHEGHLALIARALKENKYAVVSIFVNPTQFDNLDDLRKYPRTLENDIKVLEKLNKNIIVFAPSVADIYPNGLKAEHFDFEGLDYVMEGSSRKGHFDGVGTVVKRLLEIVRPNNAYFGEKDFQQLQIVKKLVIQNNLNVSIVGCPIERELDGLALSSRNVRLREDFRAEAPLVFKTLKAVKQMFKTKSVEELNKFVDDAFVSNELINLDYFKITDEATLSEVNQINKKEKYRAFIAVYAGDVRLIDNISLN